MKNFNNILIQMLTVRGNGMQILTVLIQMLPTLLPMIIALFDKGKEARIEYFESLKKAALHDQKALLAFAADSMLCWVKAASEEEWQTTGDSLKNLCSAASQFSKAQAAKREGAA